MSSIIHRPPILVQKLHARLLECEVGPQIGGREGIAREGVGGGAPEVFEDGAAVVGAAVFGQDGVVHDAEGDVVDHVVGDFLFFGIR